MAECLECGTPVTPGESFCRNCGTQQPAQTPAAEEPSSDVSTSDQQNVAGENASSEPVSLDSLGGSSTGDVDELVKHTVKKGTTGGRQPTVKQLDPGSVLNNRYEIVRRIGGGGMGAVYVAKDRNLGDAPRAVKEMVETHLDPVQHEKAIADFKRESLLLTSLEHPSIPTVYDYFYDEQLGRFYLVMKFIAGGDLASRLRSAPGGKVDEKTVADWGMQTADVLHYLHTRPKPIIYRDLKPANLMIDGNTGRVMLIDFGIARWVKQEEKGVTAVGTMGYAPPELFGGRVEPRSDVYSLGATMFHLVTGSDPQDNPLLIFDFQKNPRPRQIA
ncbi:MAG TPA: protein kinase, partial [Pyrinomonadaceae bacterium]